MSKLYQSILRFMQSEDPNGDWLDTPETQLYKEYILSVINFWLSDGLEMTPRIQYYIEYLKGNVTDIE